MNNRHRLVEKLQRRENRYELVNVLREYPSLIADIRYGLSGLTIYNLLTENHMMEMKMAFLEQIRVEAEEALEKYRQRVKDAFSEE